MSSAVQFTGRARERRGNFVPGLRKEVFFITVNTNRSLPPGTNAEMAKQDMVMAARAAMDRLGDLLFLLPRAHGEYAGVEARFWPNADSAVKVSYASEVGNKFHRFHLHMTVTVKHTGYPWISLTANDTPPPGIPPPSANLRSLIGNHPNLAQYNLGDPESWYVNAKRALDSVMNTRAYLDKDVIRAWRKGEISMEELDQRVRDNRPGRISVRSLLN